MFTPDRTSETCLSTPVEHIGMLFRVLQLGYIFMDILRTTKGTWQFGNFTVLSSTVTVRRVLILATQSLWKI